MWEVFLCLNGLTNGTGHRQKQTQTIFIKHDNSRTITNDCAEKQVDLQKGSSYCMMCYRKSNGDGVIGADGKKVSSVLRKKPPYSKYASLGCPFCDEVICQDCWVEGCDMHMKKSA